MEQHDIQDLFESVPNGFEATDRSLDFFWLCVSHFCAMTGFGLALVYEVATSGGDELLRHRWILGAIVVAAILVAPFAATLASTISKRWVVILANGFAFIVTGFATTVPTLTPTIVWCVAVIAMTIASAALLGLLPAVAKDTGLTLTRLYCLIASGTMAGIWVALAVGPWLYVLDWLGQNGASLAASMLFFAATLTPALSAFPSDRFRLEFPQTAFFRFFLESVVLLRNREPRRALLGLMLWRLLTWVVLTFAVVEYAQGRAIDFDLGREIVTWLGGGMALGLLVAGTVTQPYRAYGFVAFGMTGLFVFSLLALTHAVCHWWCLCVGVFLGMGTIGAVTQWLWTLPAATRGNGASLKNMLEALIFLVGMWLVLRAYASEDFSRTNLIWALIGVTVVGTVWAWSACFRAVVEVLVAAVLFPMYRIRGFGSGIAEFPLRGPVLVIANHNAWGDPFWLAKVLPRPVTPMMTSSFYDLPVIRFFMKHVIRAIRKQDMSFKREAPELEEAIKALDRGECVLLFPEGRLRRDPDKIAGGFGQGVWRVLKERPKTPVVYCWIEGGFGSYTSHDKGPPTKNKSPDFRRLITIAVGEPEVLTDDVLVDRRRTRRYLRDKCLAMRTLLGLEPQDPKTDAGDQNSEPPAKSEGE